jgi:hypothetical protein
VAGGDQVSDAVVLLAGDLAAGESLVEELQGVRFRLG